VWVGWRRGKGGGGSGVVGLTGKYLFLDLVMLLGNLYLPVVVSLLKGREVMQFLLVE